MATFPFGDVPPFPLAQSRPSFCLSSLSTPASRLMINNYVYSLILLKVVLILKVPSCTVSPS